MRRRIASLLPLVVVLAALLLNGCGGSSRSADPLTLADSTGRALAGTVASGRSVRLALNGQPPYATIEALVGGPGAPRTAPTGEPVFAFSRLVVDRDGALPPCVVVPALPDGDYTLSVRRRNPDGSTVPLGSRAFAIGPVAGVPNVVSGSLVGGAFTAGRAFQPGDSVVARVSGLAPGAAVDLYVLPAQGELLAGRTLVDASGYQANASAPTSQRDTRSLRGTAERATADAQGRIAPTLVWSDVHPEALQSAFRLVVDVDRDGFYQPTVDIAQEGPFAVFQTTRAAGDREATLAGMGNMGPPLSFARRNTFPVEASALVVNDPAINVQEQADYTYYIVPDQSAWADGDPLEPVLNNLQRASIAVPTAPPHLMAGGYYALTGDMAPGQYDIVVDIDNDGKYTRGVDLIDGLHGAAITVTGASAPRQKWTVLIYMNGDNSLSAATDADLEELERIDTLRGQASSDVSFVIQRDERFSGARRYIASYLPNPGMEMQEIEGLGEINMGDPQTLADFLAWGKSVRPADHYALIVWDHGTGFRTRAVTHSAALKNISWDETDGNDSLTVDEVHTVLQQQGGVDLLCFDACLMGMADLVSDFDDVALAVVASQMTEPSSGYDYTAFHQLVDNPAMGPYDLGRVIVRAWESYYTPLGKRTTNAAIDMSRAGAFRSAVDAFAGKMLDDPDGSGPRKPGLERGGVRNEVLAALAAAAAMESADANLREKYRSHKDLIDAFGRLKAGLGDTELAAAADAVLSAAQALRIDHTSTNVADHNGLAFWAPDKKGDYDALKGDYAALRFARLTRWDEFLEKLHNKEVLYRIELYAPSPELDWALSPFPVDDTTLQSPIELPADDVPGYELDSPRAERRPLKTLTVTPEAADRECVIWVSYLEVPPRGSSQFVNTGDLTIKVYKGDETTPIHTLTNHFRARAGITYNHWKALGINPQRDAITIYDTIEGSGF